MVIPYETDIELPADGVSRKTVYLEVQDEWGYKLENISVVTVEITAGQIIDTDSDLLTTGIQIPVRSGIIRLTVLAPDQAGQAVLEIDVDGTFTQIPVSYITPAEPFILVGSLNASVGNYTTSNQIHPALDDPYDNTVYVKDNNLFYGGRKAFYAKGSVWEKYRLTASFDTDRYYRNQLFEDLDPDYQYPIYGDASTLTYDAQTESMFFAKLERNQSFMVLGDYSTRMNVTEFTAYDRSFNGLLTNFQIRDNHQLVGFATLTNREMTLDEIRGEGISGYYRLSQERITRYSEKVRIEIRDRYHPETVIKSTDMVRYLNYDIHYVDGTLMFKQPIASIDPSGNPIFIVISYERKTGRQESGIGGLRYSGVFGKNFHLGSTVIAEEQSPRNYFLYGFDAKLPLTSWLAFKGEFAESHDIVTQNGEEIGQAYKTELSFVPFNSFNLKGHYRKVDKNFTNRSQSGSRFELGSEKYGMSGTLSTSRFGRISSEYYRQFNNVDSPDEIWINSLLVMYEKDFIDNGKVRLGYQQAERERKNRNLSDFFYRKSELLRGQLSYRFLPKLTGILESDINLDRKQQSKPNNTTLGVSYDLSKKLSTFLKYRFITGEKNQAQTIVGFDSKVTENTELTGKYEMGGAIGENRNQASIGLKNRWNVREDLTLNFAYENISTVDSLEVPTPKHESMSMAFEFFPDFPLKTTGKYERGRDRSANKQVFVLGTNFKVFNGLSTITKVEYFDSEYRGEGEGRILRGEYQFGLAFRPEFSDFFNTIGKVQYITDNDSHLDPGIRYDRFIASILGYIQPARRLEFGLRYARRWVRDRERGLFDDEASTDFYALRGEVDWTLKWSLALDLRYLTLAPRGEKKSGVAFEINYLVIKNMQIGLGYAFKSYKDPDFSTTALDYGHQNFYLTTHIKFSEDIFNWR